MQNDLKHKLGNAPNSEFIIGPDLKVVKKRTWSDPKQLRKDLERIIGKVKNPTQISDLNLKTKAPPKVAARGVVKRLDIPARLMPLKIKPIEQGSKHPFYAKLRAEAERDLLSRGDGKLYLAFHMDPIYHVHWNNLVKPIQVTIEAPEGVKLSKTKLTGPKVKAAGDIDPREFLIDVSGTNRKEPLKLKVSYFACNDEAGWCKPVTQEYLVYLERDPDGGSARRGGSRRGGGGRRPMFGGGRRPTTGRIVSVDTKKNTVTVMTRDRKRGTYEISKNARLMRDRKPAKLADFKAGDMVMIRLDKNTVQGMMARGSRGKRPGGNRPGGNRPGFGNADEMIKRILQRDRNKDGKLSREELGPRGARLFERGDANKDGFLTKEELKKAFENSRPQRKRPRE